MENRDLNTFGRSAVQIEDGFQYGDWRDQCVSDTQYDDCFTPKISLIDNKISKNLNEPELICETKSILKQPSSMNEANHLKKIKKNNTLNGDSPNSSESNNSSRSFSPVKSKDSDEYVSAVKPKCSRANVHLRKDVINKTIIRAFNRFYIQYFKSKLNCSNKTSGSIHSILKQKVHLKIISSSIYQECFDIDDYYDSESKCPLKIINSLIRFIQTYFKQLIYLGLIASQLTFKFIIAFTNSSPLLDLIVNIIAWMTCSKSMKAKLNRYFRGIEEIQILNDILSSYSHKKFNKMFKYEAIRTLFEAFMTEEREHFLSSFTGVQRSRYEEELRTIAVNFNKQQWKPLNIEE